MNQVLNCLYLCMRKCSGINPSTISALIYIYIYVYVVLGKIPQLYGPHVLCALALVILSLLFFLYNVFFYNASNQSNGIKSLLGNAGIRTQKIFIRRSQYKPCATDIIKLNIRRISLFENRQTYLINIQLFTLLNISTSIGVNHSSLYLYIINIVVLCARLTYWPRQYFLSHKICALINDKKVHLCYFISRIFMGKFLVL